jgi:hypothetical protein
VYVSDRKCTEQEQYLVDPPLSSPLAGASLAGAGTNRTITRCPAIADVVGNDADDAGANKTTVVFADGSTCLECDVIMYAFTLQLLYARFCIEYFHVSNTVIASHMSEGDFQPKPQCTPPLL